jgi:5-methylthioadenosine/S-adenosylhomocysteine deaminase
VEKEFVGPEFCRLGTLLSCAEMIRSGATCFADMYYFENEVAKATDEAGMRAICAETIMKLPTSDAVSYDESMEYCEYFISRWLDHPRIVPAVGPHSIYMCTPELLRQTVELAQKYEVPLLIHLSETAREVEECQQQNGWPPVLWAEAQGVFEADKVLAAHCVHVSELEMMRLLEHGVGVAHNPTSNLKLASGVANVARMLELGIKVGLGTDGSASNNDQDMFEEMHLAALLPKGTSYDPTAVPARLALAMATSIGACALHLEHLIGSIEVGKRADLAVVDLRAPHFVPRFQTGEGNIYSQLVYAAKSSDVRDVMIDGAWVMRERNLLTIDLEQVQAQAQEIAGQISSFLVEREQEVLRKAATIGGMEQLETFEVQVKTRVGDAAVVERLLAHPDVILVKRTERRQYDSYLLFDDPKHEYIRYREDYYVQQGRELDPLYTLTVISLSEEREFGRSIILTRSRLSAAAEHSLRFYREYFQPDRVKEVNKERTRMRIKYRGVEFAVNLDRLLKPEYEDLFLEIKARTWSKNDALRKAELIGELLDILQVAQDDLLKKEYVNF